MANKSISPIARMIQRLTEDQWAKMLPDGELLRRFTSGQDEAAYSALLRRHGSMVLDVCRNVAGNEADAEDAFQATFLVLARKAKSIRKMTSVASWLHGVAYRTALHGRRECARRRKHETRVQRATGTASADDLSWHEVQQTIHAELAALSERYRAPLVLCFLEGTTQDEAAKQLGIAKATLKNRLERGRSLLRVRLVRQGLGSAAMLTAAAWPTAKASACVRPTLAAGTVKAALALAGGQTTAGLVSAKVSYLAANAVKVALATKVTIGAAVVLALALVPTLGERVFQTRSTDVTSGRTSSQASPQADTPKGEPSTPKSSESQKKQTLSGRVLDPTGKPAAGAKLFLAGASDRPTELGECAADGSFRVTTAAPPTGKLYYLVAQIAGAGLDFTGVWESGPTDPIELRAVKDNPIRGRVINTEGKPVAGVRVSVTQVCVYADNSLESFLLQMKKRHFMSGIPRGLINIDPGHGAILSVTTDVEGRFAVEGAGVERSITLTLSGAEIAESEVWVVNRPGFDPGPYNQASLDRIPKDLEDLAWPMWLVHGPDLSVVAEAEKRIRGVVKDIDTGKPRGGVTVRLTRNGEALLALPLMTTADSEGRYEIRGARKASDYMVEVSSDTAAGYMARQVHVADTPGYEPITADIAVKKGVVVTGRVLDAVTKKPVPGYAVVDPLSDNPFYTKYPQFDVAASANWEKTGPDHKFRLVTIPGPVLLQAGVDSRRNAAGEMARSMYKPSISDPKYPRYFKYEGGGFVYFHPGGGRSPLHGNYCIVLQIKPDDQVVTHDILLERATALPIKIQKVGGGPLAGTWVTGLSSERESPVQIKSDSCSVYNLEPGKPRLMVLYEPNKKLVGTLALKGNEKEPAVATLGQSGSLKGRLIGEDGKPLVGIVINLHFRESTVAEIHHHLHRAKLMETDIDGQFHMDEIVPGQNFWVAFIRGQQTFEPLSKIEDSSVQAGATLDLGEIKLKRKVEQEN